MKTKAMIERTIRLKVVHGNDNIIRIKYKGPKLGSNESRVKLMVLRKMWLLKMKLHIILNEYFGLREFR